MISTRIRNTIIKNQNASAITCTVYWDNKPLVYEHCIGKLVNPIVYMVYAAWIVDNRLFTTSEKELLIEVSVRKTISTSEDFFPDKIEIDNNKCKIYF